MLTSDIKLIASPVVLDWNGKQKEYENGTAAALSLEPHNCLNVTSLCIRDNKIVVTLAEWESNPPSNLIGEAAVE